MKFKKTVQIDSNLNSTVVTTEVSHGPRNYKMQRDLNSTVVTTEDNIPLWDEECEHYLNSTVVTTEGKTLVSSPFTGEI